MTLTTETKRTRRKRKKTRKKTKENKPQKNTRRKKEKRNLFFFWTPPVYSAYSTRPRKNGGFFFFGLMRHEGIIEITDEGIVDLTQGDDDDDDDDNSAQAYTAYVRRTRADRADADERSEDREEGAGRADAAEEGAFFFGRMMRSSACMACRTQTFMVGPDRKAEVQHVLRARARRRSSRLAHPRSATYWRLNAPKPKKTKKQKKKRQEKSRTEKNKKAKEEKTRPSPGSTQFLAQKTNRMARMRVGPPGPVLTFTSSSTKPALSFLQNFMHPQNEDSSR